MSKVLAKFIGYCGDCDEEFIVTVCCLEPFEFLPYNCPSCSRTLDEDDIKEQYDEARAQFQAREGVKK